jgi:hypothetical protein
MPKEFITLSEHYKESRKCQKAEKKKLERNLQVLLCLGTFVPPLALTLFLRMGNEVLKAGEPSFPILREREREREREGFGIEEEAFPCI